MIYNVAAAVADSSWVMPYLQVDRDTLDMLRAINLGSLQGVTLAQVSERRGAWQKKQQPGSTDKVLPTLGTGSQG